MKKIKVLILHNIMAPYRFPLFREIAKNPLISLEVWFLSKSAQNRRWKIQNNSRLPFKYKILPKIEFNFQGKDLFTWILNPTFPWEFQKKDFDILISAGWLDFASQCAFIMCMLKHKPYIIWSESTVNEPSWRRTLTKPLVKFFINHANAYLAISQRSKEYLISLGAKPEKIFKAVSSVDNNHFYKKSRLSGIKKTATKDKLKIKEEKIILYAGQLIERKGIGYLLSAFQQIRKEDDNIGLLLVGYGLLKEKLVKFVKQNAVKGVYFQDHVELNEIPQMYGIADVFVLPSLEETFGLVVNEAMASRLPVIVTDRIGSCEDLVIDGYNGYVVPSADADEIRRAIIKILNRPIKTQKMGRNSWKLIQKFSPESQAKGFVTAIKSCSRSIKVKNEI